MDALGNAQALWAAITHGELTLKGTPQLRKSCGVRV
jgi:hypothetical protein